MELSPRFSRVRRQILVAGAALPAFGFAQSPPFPSRPIRIVVGFPPGGAVDTSARLIAAHMTKLSGQPVVVDTRLGAGGTIAAAAVAKAAPDGHTLLLTIQFPLVSAQALFSKLPYDPNREFAFISPILAGNLLFVVSRSVPATSLKEFIEYARRTPGVAIGSFGQGSQAHLAVDAINKHYGLALPHVAYKGEAPMTQDIMGGHLAAGFGSFFTMAGAIQMGHMRAVAVTNGPRGNRMALLPNVGTFEEQGLNDPVVTLSGWTGILTTAGTPRPIIAKLNEWIRSALADTQVRSKLEEFGVEVVSSTPEEFESRFRVETPIWIKAVSATGVKMD